MASPPHGPKTCQDVFLVWAWKRANRLWKFKRRFLLAPVSLSVESDLHSRFHVPFSLDNNISDPRFYLYPYDSSTVKEHQKDNQYCQQRVLCASYHFCEKHRNTFGSSLRPAGA